MQGTAMLEDRIVMEKPEPTEKEPVMRELDPSELIDEKLLEDILAKTKVNPSNEEYRYTFEYIQTKIGFKKPFLERCVATFTKEPYNDILEPFFIRGEQQRKFYNYDALLIFNNIKKYKNLGLNLQEMATKIRNQDVQNAKKLDKNQSESVQNVNNQIPGNFISLDVLKEIQGREERLKKENDELSKELTEKEKLFFQFQTNLKLLTDGKDPHAVREDLDRLRVQDQLIKQLQEINSKWFFIRMFLGGKKKTLIKMLEMTYTLKTQESKIPGQGIDQEPTP